MPAVIRDLVANGVGRRHLPEAVGASCATLLDIEHSGLLLADDDGNLTALATTTPMMALVEDLEVTLGAGPCTDAYHHGRPVEETDLAGADHARWIGFDSPALAAGVRAVFAFPLQVTGASVGSLNLARLEPGALTGDQHLDAVALAGVVAQLLVTLPVETAGGALELDDLVQHRTVVHQATGMVGAQLDVTMAVGLALLRARAFADDRSLEKVAADVVEHRVRFDT
jgi:hypothetical protein